MPQEAQAGPTRAIMKTLISPAPGWKGMSRESAISQFPQMAAMMA
ncbi:MAG: hypothetical protein ACLT38_02640 [Akkermansia sp.]